ncbi:ubiquitin-protein ligase [Lithospermum erythrorhizon]|uniref:Ubiquitin-protein ligase n=1 Tax=Lithospermum erythrorhizon TaxID=34254 RepID=A0AAV3Q8R9_LITER
MENKNSTNSLKNDHNFEKGWIILQEEAINKLINSLEAGAAFHGQLFTSEQYMHLSHYISVKVLPSLRGKADEVLLQELLKQWNNYKIMTYWLSRFFHYLERSFIKVRKLLTLKETSHLVFYELVYGEINDLIRGAVISMIRNEREGREIDQALVKNVLHIYIQMCADSVKYYEKDFEGAMLDDTASFYSTTAKDWISNMSYDEECLNQETDRSTNYLKHTNKIKLLEYNMRYSRT